MLANVNWLSTHFCVRQQEDHSEPPQNGQHCNSHNMREYVKNHGPQRIAGAASPH
jgi:hypothetical protein